MGNTGAVTQAGTLQAGGVLAQARRGAQGRSGHAAGRLPGSVGTPHGSDRWSARRPEWRGRGSAVPAQRQSGLGAPYPILSTAWPVLSVTGCTHAGRYWARLRVNERLHPAEVCGT